MNELRIPPALAVVAGSSGSGKTTFLEKLIAWLTNRGYRVVTLKHVRQFQLDQPGKDSWRHRRAGASATALLTDFEYAVLGEGVTAAHPEEIFPYLPQADLILAEGFKNSGLPKIAVVRAAVSREIVAAPPELVAVVSDLPEIQTAVPVFPLDLPESLGKWIVRNYLTEKTAELELTHFDGAGRARMVEVAEKPSTKRVAVAKGTIRMKPETFSLIKDGTVKKGDVLGVARIAAIMAVKETPRLIPLCHPLNLTGVEVDFDLAEAGKVEITVKVSLCGQTGVEMEALTGVSVAALTIYDMCKAADKTMEIGAIRLVEKSGGRSGHFWREEG